MRGFAGFSTRPGEARLPADFFSELLPLIDDLTELKLTLLLLRDHAIGDGVRALSYEQLRSESDLLAALGETSASSPEEALRRVLERMTARGTLIRVVASREGETTDLYLVNDDAGRAMAADIRAGRPAQFEAEPHPSALRVQRPNIFVLYEQNIGLLQPLIVDELKEAEKTYPMSWIEDAFRIAVERNARHWRYIRAILERWAREGKMDGTDQDDPESIRRRYAEGKYGRIIKR